MPIFVHFD